MGNELKRKNRAKQKRKQANVVKIKIHDDSNSEVENNFYKVMSKHYQAMFSVYKKKMANSGLSIHRLGMDVKKAERIAKGDLFIAVDYLGFSTSECEESISIAMELSGLSKEEIMEVENFVLSDFEDFHHPMTEGAYIKN